MPLANEEYSILHETGTGTNYRTSPYHAGELHVNQSVQIVLPEDANHLVKVVSESLPEGLYASRIGVTEIGDYTPPTIGMPVLENDILFFEDEKHLQDYYDALSHSIEDNVTVESFMEEKLNLFEQYYPGYASYRSLLNSEYDWSDISDQEMDEAMTRDFIKDDIRKTLLNRNRFIGIGDFIYYCHSENVTVKIDKKDRHALGVLSEISPYDDLFGPNSPVLGNSAFELIAPLIKDPMLKDEVVFNSSIKFMSSLLTQNVNCSIYKKMLRVDVQRCEWQTASSTWACSTYMYNNTNGGILTINWGDSTTQVVSDYYGQWIEHTYSAMGSFLPSTALYLNYGGVTVHDNADAFNVLSSCTEHENSTSNSITSGDWKLTASLWTFNNFWGRHIGSYSEAWKKKSNGNWERKKADIFTDVNGVFRNDACVQEETASDSKHHSNDKKVQVKKTKWFEDYDISNGDVKSHHTLNKDGITLILDLVLNPC